MNPLNQSINPDVLEKLLQEAQKETNYPSTSISVQSSPKSPQTPISNSMYNRYTQNQSIHNCHCQLIQNQSDILVNSQNNFNNNNNSNNETFKKSITASTLRATNSNAILHDDLYMYNNTVGTINDEHCFDIESDEAHNDASLNIKKDTDWIWYWSSRPQMQPPK